MDRSKIIEQAEFYDIKMYVMGATSCRLGRCNEQHLGRVPGRTRRPEGGTPESPEVLTNAAAGPEPETRDMLAAAAPQGEGYA